MYEQQLLGFFHERDNCGDVIGLIMAMGMTIEEWQILKKDYNLEYLPKNSFDEIEEYFNNQQ